MAASGDSEAMIAKVTAAISEAEKVFVLPAREEEPYEHMYAARKLLEPVLEEVDGACRSAEGSHAVVLKDLRAKLQRHIGSNKILTEENPDGLKLLRSCTEYLFPRLLDEPAGEESQHFRLCLVVDALDAANYMCLVESGYSKLEECLQTLAKVERLYSSVVEVAASLESDEERAAAAEVERLYTHSLFYAAQVHAASGDAAKSAHFCELTLIRQLPSALETEGEAELDEGSDRTNGLTWGTNAIKLSAYFISEEQFTKAAHCLQAAGRMLSLALASVHRRSQPKAPAADAAAGAEAEASSATPPASASASPPTPPSAQDDSTAPALPAASAATGAGEGAGAGQEEAKAVPLSAISAKETSDVARVATAQLADDHELNGVEDSILAAMADCRSHWGRLYTVSLECARDLLWVSRGQMPADSAPAGDRIKEEGEESLWGTDKGPFDALLEGSPRRQVPDVASITGYEQAAAVFKLGLGFQTKALEYYVLDGFVSKHIDIKKDISRSYKYLAAFVTDPKRAGAMHQRRVDLLAPLLDELNPSIYIVALKELSHEAATAATEVMEMRITRAEASGKWKKSAMRAVTKMADEALRLHSFFVSCWKDERVTGLEGLLPAPAKPLSGATHIDDESMEAYLSAHFAIARVLSKRMDAKSRVGDMSQSLKRFRWLLKAAPKLVPEGQPEVFRQELQIVREMTELLPAKIDKLHYYGNDVDMQ